MAMNMSVNKFTGTCYCGKKDDNVFAFVDILFTTQTFYGNLTLTFLYSRKSSEHTKKP